MITKGIKVYLHGGGFPVVIPVSQFDTMWQFVFTIYNGSTIWSIPSNATAILNGAKPDGNVFAFSGDISANTVTINCDTQMTACAGDTICELSILSGGKVVGTANFTLRVEKAPKSPDDISSDSTLPAYDILLDAAANLSEITAESVSEWLEEHITQSTDPVIDSSLLVEGAAAESATVGNRLAEISEQNSINLADNRNVEVNGFVTNEIAFELTRTGFRGYTLSPVQYGILQIRIMLQPNTRYTVACVKNKISGNGGVGVRFRRLDSYGNLTWEDRTQEHYLISSSAPDGVRLVSSTFTNNTPFTTPELSGEILLSFHVTKSTSAESGDVTWEDIMLVEGEYTSEDCPLFVRTVYAQDDEARSKADYAYNAVAELAEELAEVKEDTDFAVEEVAKFDDTLMFRRVLEDNENLLDLETGIYYKPANITIQNGVVGVSSPAYISVIGDSINGFSYLWSDLTSGFIWSNYSYANLREPSDWKIITTEKDPWPGEPYARVADVYRDLDAIELNSRNRVVHEEISNELDTAPQDNPSEDSTYRKMRLYKIDTDFYYMLTGVSGGYGIKPTGRQYPVWDPNKTYASGYRVRYPDESGEVYSSDKSNNTSTPGVADWTDIGPSFYIKPKAFLIAAQHGDERSNPRIVVDFIQKLLWDEKYKKIAAAFQWYIIPVVNIYGYNHNTRYNGGEPTRDINRDYSDNTYTYEGETYGFQTTEANIVKSVYAANEFQLFLDIHNYAEKNLTDSKNGFIALTNLDQNRIKDYERLWAVCEAAGREAEDWAKNAPNTVKTDKQLCYMWNNLNNPTLNNSASAAGYIRGNTDFNTETALQHPVFCSATVETGRYAPIISGIDGVGSGYESNRFNRIAMSFSNVYVEAMIKGLAEEVLAMYYAPSGGSGGGAVNSVNGQTGTVVLTASNVGAIPAPSSPASGSFLVWNGSAWVAQTLATWQGGNY